MHKEIRDHVAQYCKRKGWRTDTDTIIEVITEGEQVYRAEGERHRWWNEYEYVVRIDGMLIGYIDAEASGDMSASERGYEFDPASICEMKAVEVTIVTYEVVS